MRSRASAIADRTALLNELRTATVAAVKQELRARIALAKASAKRLEAAARDVIAADPVLQRRLDVLVSIPGVGAATAATLIANMPELGSLDEKEVAMLAGLAPIAHESGDTVGQRRIKGGRREVRTACYLPALSAVRVNPSLKAFYRRLVDDGKLKMVALAAAMRKLIVLANALLKADRLWSLTPPSMSKTQPIHA